MFANQVPLRVQESRVCEMPTYQRRLNQRFPITARTEYIVGGNRGQATTRNISSGGVFLKTNGTLPAGEPIQVLIDWPALLEGHRLRLVFWGRVVRSNDIGTAVAIHRYEFRVCAQTTARLSSVGIR